MINTLNQQLFFENNQFPTRIMEASEILSNHLYKTNQTKLFQKNQTSLNQNTNENASGETNTNIQVTPTLSFAQLETRCYCCGKTGHKSP